MTLASLKRSRREWQRSLVVRKSEKKEEAKAEEQKDDLKEEKAE